MASFLIPIAAIPSAGLRAMDSDRIGRQESHYSYGLRKTLPPEGIPFSAAETGAFQPRRDGNLAAGGAQVKLLTGRQSLLL